MMMSSAYATWKLHRTHQSSAVAFAFSWAEAMEDAIRERDPYSTSVEDVIKDVCFRTSSDADTETYVAARNILVECWHYGNILAKYA